jgi:hypothetical protein
MTRDDEIRTAKPRHFPNPASLPQHRRACSENARDSQRKKAALRPPFLFYSQNRSF